jgi:hypothetical protein
MTCLRWRSPRTAAASSPVVVPLWDGLTFFKTRRTCSLVWMVVCLSHMNFSTVVASRSKAFYLSPPRRWTGASYSPLFLPYR